MKHVLAAVLGLALLAVSPRPDLIAGSVRDQHGLAVAGARITVLDGERIAGSARTASDGTFVFTGAGSAVSVECRFCRPVRVDVDAEGIATAVVYRYDALVHDGPSADDLAHLPFASPADLLELVPYVVVNRTSRTVPGTSATDRNATPYGGLLLVDGAPDYDVNANVTTFDTVPQGAASGIDVLRVDQAYRYGDTAQGGTFDIETAGGDSYAGSGGVSVLRAAGASEDVRAAASLSSAAAGVHAQRGSAAIDLATPGLSGDLRLSSGSGYDAPSGSSALFSSFSSGTADVHTRGRIDAFTTLTADRGTYAYTSAKFPQTSVWSDVDLAAGVTSHATLAPFFFANVRESAGSYLSSATGTDGIAGSLSQARVTAGLTYHTDAVDAVAAGGSDDAGYAGILGPGSRDSKTASDSVLSATWRASAQWSLHASSSTGYALPPFLAVYDAVSPGYAYAIASTHTNEATLEYSDTARVRLGATALNWSSDGGVRTASGGLSATWQIAPKLALRTWMLTESSTAWATGTVGSAWLTYANGAAFRADLFVGRSLLDREPRNAVSAAISGRLNDRIDWFVSSSNVAGVQGGTAGVRIHERL